MEKGRKDRIAGRERALQPPPAVGKIKKQLSRKTKESQMPNLEVLMAELDVSDPDGWMLVIYH